MAPKWQNGSRQRIEVMIKGNGKSKATPALISALEDSAKSVRSSAAIALRKLGNNAISELWAAVQNHPSKTVRESAKGIFFKRM